MFSFKDAGEEIVDVCKIMRKLFWNWVVINVEELGVKILKGRIGFFVFFIYDIVVGKW